MADRYRDFNDLAARTRLGIDYRILVEDRGPLCAVIAPHGGWIEPHTSLIAQAIAGSDLSFYAFEALNKGAHRDFHITSHHFDEPRAINLVGSCRTAVAIHGRRSEGSESVWLGGLATDLRDRIGALLRDAGFQATPNKSLPGQDLANICNRTRSGRGVQLELPRSLRDQLAAQADLLQAFSQAIRDAIFSSPAR